MSRIQPDHRPNQTSARRDAINLSEQARTPPPREAQENFRALLEARRAQAEKLPQQADQLPKETSSAQSVDFELRLAEWSTAAELQHDLLARASQPAAAAGSGPASPAGQAAVVELIERHVRRMLISTEAEQVNGPRSLVLRLNDELLVNCDLKLERTEQGWQLDASSSDHGTIGLLTSEVPRLKARFASAGLGTLDVRIADRRSS